jgi:superfamily I DNA and RNA helicase
MESDFIMTEPLGTAGESGEQTVWDAVKRAFSGRNVLAYWRYPIFSTSGSSRKEPDILIADRELGLIVIEVKSIRMAQLQRINGHAWHLSGHHASTIQPYQQAENQLFALLGYCDQEPLLRRAVAGRALVALPWVESGEWLERGFHSLPSCPPVLFGDNLGRSTLLNTVKDAPQVSYGQVLTPEAFLALKGVLAGTPVYGRPEVERELTGRAEIITQAREKLYAFDLQQETIAKQIPPGPQRIRGIAGSGKTVLLCQKAAQMHLKHPGWDIALVFFNRSLYDVMTGTLDKWLRRFTKGAQGYDPANSKLKVLHAWGATNQPGFYRELTLAHGIPPLPLAKLPKGLTPTQSYLCLLKLFLEALEKRNKPVIPLYDAILVDEGQDLVADERFKYVGKQPFYWLAYQALRPAKQAAEARALFEEAQRDTSGQRRLIWAYDEAQSLDSLTIPTYREVFGEAVSQQMLAGGVSYVGGISKNEVMPKCYRTPGPILTAAHSIGMGLLRPQGMISGLTTKEDWRNLGYEVSGDFRKFGEEIRLKRPLGNSLNPVPGHYGQDVLSFKPFTTRAEEVAWVAEQVARDVEEGIDPSREVLIIALGNHTEATQVQRSLALALEARGLDYFVPAAPGVNTLEVTSTTRKPNAFWHPGAVTVSRIHQAKGNEADIVYIVGFDAIARREADVTYRNQIFVALTRSRGFAHLSGVGRHLMFEEMEQVLAAGQEFSFTFLKQPKRDLNERVI